MTDTVRLMNRAQRRAAMKTQPRSARRYPAAMGQSQEMNGGPSIGEQIGLGPFWQMTSSQVKLIPAQAPDGSKHYVVRFSTAVGVIGLTFADAELRALGQMIGQITTGLEIAPAGLLTS